MNSKSRSNKTLCEKSMKVVTNVIRLSSFSIARMSLRNASQPGTVKTHASAGPAAFIKGSATAQFPESLRLQEPVMNTSKPIAYLIEAVDQSDESSSMYVVHDKNGVDGRASDFIRRVHEKNRRDSKEALSYSAFIIPPPPRFM